MTHCLAEDTVVDYLQGVVTEAARTRVEDHIADCDRCRQLVSEAIRALPPASAQSSSNCAPPVSIWTGANSDANANAGANTGADADAGAPAPPPGTGESIGRYQLLDVIGTGGMGLVYRAFDPHLSRTIAIKLLRPQADAIDKLQRMLASEAKALAQLSHPNVVTVYDIGTANGLMYIAMELIRGQTASQWLRVRKRSWREIVQLFAAAGAGLAAAHDGGIIHRDFKPDNILVGHDGRVLVADFGLAEVGAAANAAHAIAGTPQYMAPEYFRGHIADPRADQFSFCVALYQGLYGRRPFCGSTVAEIAREITAGRIQPIGKGRRDHGAIPGWLRRIIWRGLSTSPDERYPSMTDLLAALAAGLGRKRRWQRAAGIGAMMMTAAVALWWTSGESQASAVLTCDNREAQLARTWNPEQQRALRSAFVATHISFAGDAADRVGNGLDRYARQWQRAADDVCTANDESSRDSRRDSSRDGTVELQVHCLAGRLQRLRALVHAYRSADEKTIENAVQALETLPPIALCRNAHRLGRVPMPPRDPQVRAEVRTLRRRLADIQSMYATGKFAPALAQSVQLAQSARPLDYAPLQAEILAVQGTFQLRMHREDAEDTLREAAQLAAASGHDEILAVSYLRLIETSTWIDMRFEQAQRWEKLASGVIERIGAPARMRSALLDKRGDLDMLMGNYDAAETWYRRAIDAEREQAAPSPLQLSTLHNAIGIVNLRRSHHDKAQAAYLTALDLVIEAVGTEHPATANLHNNLGVLYRDMGSYQRAVDHYRQSLQVLERVFGRDHSATAAPLSGIGSMHFLMGDSQSGMDLMRRALAIQETSYGLEHPLVGEALVNIGYALNLLGRYEEAETELGRSLAIAEAWSRQTVPYVAVATSNLGDALLGLGRHDEARKHYERAIELIGDMMGEGSRVMAEARKGLGLVALAEGDRGQALRQLRRAMDILNAFAHDPLLSADVHFALAQARWPTDQAHSRELAERALAGYANSGLHRQRQRIVDWLAERRP